MEHNLLKQGINGMAIHFSFMIADLKESKCGAMAPFYYEYKQPLRDFNKAYCTPEGYGAVDKAFTPPSERAIYQDFVLFMPYDELHITPPSHDYQFNLTVVIRLYVKSSRRILLQSNTVRLTLKSGNAPA